MPGDEYGRRSRAMLLAEFLRTLVHVARWRLVFALLLPVLGGLSEGAGILLLVPLLQQVGVDVHEGSTASLARAINQAFVTFGLSLTLPAVLGVFTAVMIVRALIGRAQVLAQPVVDQLVLVHFREALYRAFLQARWSYFVQRRLNDLTHAVMTDAFRVSALTYQSLTMAAGATVLLVYVALAIRVSPALAMLVAGCGVLLLWLQRGSGAPVSQAGQRTSSSSAELHHLVAESLSGLKTTRSYGAGERTLRVFRQLNEDVRAAYLDFIRASAGTRFRFQVSSAALLALVLYLAIDVLALEAASLLIILFLFARLMPQVAALQASGQVILSALPSFERIQILLDTFGAHAEEPSGSDEPVLLQRRLSVDCVEYRYAGAADAALASVSLEIPAWRTTAIVGPSGGGKSTLADLLMGLLMPSAGSISVDGVPLTPARLSAWRSRIGYVPQETFLLNDTIRANLLWAAPDAGEDSLWRALDMAQAGEFTRRLPAALDAMVGDRGVRLSGGERQRLALARALLRKPDLLILDEATSSLDSEHERRIQAAIDALHGRITMIVITHRLFTVRHADTIHLLEHGRLVESGSWDSLLSRQDSRFRALCELQHVEPRSSSVSGPRDA